MNNQEENNWYAIHRPEDPEGDAQIAKNMAYAAETGALKMNANELNEYFDGLEATGERPQFPRDPNPQPYQPQTTSPAKEYMSIEEFNRQKAARARAAERIHNRPLQSHSEFMERKNAGQISEGNGVYAVDPNPRQPQGSFGMNGVQYKYVNGKWTAIKPDGTPMNDAEMYQHTSQMHQKKPGNVTGKPLLPSRLFQKPTIAQR